jgi:hypothetical protein
VLRKLEELARSFGPRFTPSEEIRRRALSGEAFYSGLALPVPV